MKNYLKKKIAELICWICKKLDIYIMVNLKLQSNDLKLTQLTEEGCIRYCQFAGKVTIYNETI
jgi:hypothetical protein